MLLGVVDVVRAVRTSGGIVSRRWWTLCIHIHEIDVWYIFLGGSVRLTMSCGHMWCCLILLGLLWLSTFQRGYSVDQEGLCISMFFAFDLSCCEMNCIFYIKMSCRWLRRRSILLRLLKPFEFVVLIFARRRRTVYIHVLLNSMCVRRHYMYITYCNRGIPWWCCVFLVLSSIFKFHGTICRRGRPVYIHVLWGDQNFSWMDFIFCSSSILWCYLILCGRRMLPVAGGQLPLYWGPDSWNWWYKKGW